MQYRDYGQTGMTVSTLGFGAMRLPTLEDGTCDFDKSIPLLRRGIDLGVTYIDTAWGYINGTSEVAVGRAIKPYDRARLIIATKIPSNDINGRTWRQRLETQLERFDMGYIDVMHAHGLTWGDFQTHGLGEEGWLREARRAQSEGLVRYLAFSSHDTPENVVKLVETGEFDGLTLQYNLLDRRMEEPIRRAHERGMGTVIMGPVGGGRLSLWNPQQVRDLMPESVTSTPDLAIRWVLANPHVSVALSGMNTMAMIEENAGSAGRPEPLTAEELQAVETMMVRLRDLARLYCTGCGYCLPCPNGIDIPGSFLLMNYYRVYGIRDYAVQQYARLLKGEDVWLQNQRIEGKPASACVQCGECEPKCPQNIAIIEQLQEVEATLGGAAH